MNYIKKIKNNKEISQVYCYYGDTDNFDAFRGGERWKMNKQMERFSNDRCFEMDGENKNGGYIGKYFGIGKRKYRIDEGGIGVKK
jgi:hypothetical protein